MNTHPFGVTLPPAERRMDWHDETGSGFSQPLYERAYSLSRYLRSELVFHAHLSTHNKETLDKFCLPKTTAISL
jgi:hypothetical protein